MPDETTIAPRTDSLGDYLKAVRLGLGLTLRDVEKLTENDVSNAYLSQLENRKIEKPSPHILYALSNAYRISYKNLMSRAGYVIPQDKSRKAAEKHGNAATFAIENLSAQEEAALLEYLAFFRSKRGSS